MGKYRIEAETAEDFRREVLKAWRAISDAAEVTALKSGATVHYGRLGCILNFTFENVDEAENFDRISVVEPDFSDFEV